MLFSSIRHAKCHKVIRLSCYHCSPGNTFWFNRAPASYRTLSMNKKQSQSCAVCHFVSEPEEMVTTVSSHKLKAYHDLSSTHSTNILKFLLQIRHCAQRDIAAAGIQAVAKMDTGPAYGLCDQLLVSPLSNPQPDLHTASAFEGLI